MQNINHSLEERIDVDYSEWLHQKNEIVSLTITCRVLFAALIILASTLGFVMFAQPHLDELPYTGMLFDSK